MREKWLILPSYEVITGLYFRAESQNIRIDNTTPQEAGEEEFVKEVGE